MATDIKLDDGDCVSIQAPGGIKLNGKLLDPTFIKPGPLKLAHLEANAQATVELPKNGQIGDLVFIHTAGRFEKPGADASSSLWLCTGYQKGLNDQSSTWSQVTVGQSVVGTLP